MVGKKKRSSILVKPWVAFLATVPALLSICLLGLFPAIINIVLSFTNYSGPFQPYEFVGFKNYIMAFQTRSEASVTVFSSLKNTMIFSFFVVLLQQPLSLLIGLLIAKKSKINTFFKALFFMPTILGISVIGFIWQLVLDPVSGPIAVFLHNLGKNSAFLGDEKIAMALVIFVAIWANFGYSMAIYIAGIQNISDEMKEAAIIDGANPFQLVMRIIIPLLRNSFIINYWISISGTLAMFDIIFVLTNGGANTTTFALYFFKLATNSSANQGAAAALSIYFSIFVSLVMIAFHSIFKKRDDLLI